jgi:hypothetical protein
VRPSRKARHAHRSHTRAQRFVARFSRRGVLFVPFTAESHLARQSTLCGASSKTTATQWGALSAL